eukprot:5224136-Prymnesium_polylepis.2
MPIFGTFRVAPTTSNAFDLCAAARGEVTRLRNSQGRKVSSSVAAIQSAHRKADARLAAVGTPLRIATRLCHNKWAYSAGVPRGQMTIITSAVLRVAEYSSESQLNSRSSCRYRRLTLSSSSYSNTSHRKVLNMRVAVLGTRTKVRTLSHGDSNTGCWIQRMQTRQLRFELVSRQRTASRAGCVAAQRAAPQEYHGAWGYRCKHLERPPD